MSFSILAVMTSALSGYYIRDDISIRTLRLAARLTGSLKGGGGIPLGSAFWGTSAMAITRLKRGMQRLVYRRMQADRVEPLLTAEPPIVGLIYQSSGRSRPNGGSGEEDRSGRFTRRFTRLAHRADRSTTVCECLMS